MKKDTFMINNNLHGTGSMTNKTGVAPDYIHKVADIFMPQLLITDGTGHSHFPGSRRIANLDSSDKQSLVNNIMPFLSPGFPSSSQELKNARFRMLISYDEFPHLCSKIYDLLGQNKNRGLFKGRRVLSKNDSFEKIKVLVIDHLGISSEGAGNSIGRIGINNKRCSEL